jgi:hypothetical protein
MGTINDMTHIKTIFSFLPGNGRHFIGNVLCSSDGCCAAYSHFALFHDKQKPPEAKIQRSQIWRMGGQGMGSSLPVQ